VTGNPQMQAEFAKASHAAEKHSHFVRTSERYPLCGTGDVNTYALFAELALHAMDSAGRAGVIVPTNIATDDTTKLYFQAIMADGQLASLYDFENRRKIFAAVDSRMKFCLLTLRGEAEGGGAAEFVFFAQDVADLQEEQRRFTLSAAEIALLNPNTRTCPIFRSKRDAELTKAIYRRVPVLIQEGPPEQNPWGVKFATMFHMSNDSHLFRTRTQLEEEGWTLEGNRFVKEGECYLPLYEAKMMHQFDHCWATYDGLETQDVALAQKETPTFAVLPRYWVDSSQVKDRLGDNHRQWFIAFRDVARSTDERTAIFCILPRVAVGHTAPLFFANAKPADSATLQAALSSYVFDYVTRQSVGGTHLTYGYVKQLSVLPPETYANSCPWDLSADNLRDWLLPRVLELTYTAWDLEGFARECGYSGPPFRWDEERRFLLRCELDAAYFHLYGIARDDVDYILESFPIVRRKELATWGRYRSKETILEIYDALGEAQRTGAPYATRLDPPPAHARAAHGPAGPAPARA